MRDLMHVAAIIALTSAFLLAAGFPGGFASVTTGATPWLSSGNALGVDTPGPGTDTCYALAPLDTPDTPLLCATLGLNNPHTLGSGGLTIGFTNPPPGPVPFTGTAQIVVSHSSGEIDFRCSWHNDVFVSCQIVSLVFPTPGASFDVHCSSIAVSVGHWECFISH